MMFPFFTKNILFLFNHIFALFQPDFKEK